MTESIRMVAAAALAAGLGWAGHDIVTRTPSDEVPVHFDHVDVLRSPPVFEQGELIPVRIWRKKFRDDCFVTSERKAIRLSGHEPEIFTRPEVTWQGGPAQTDYFDYAYTTSAFKGGPALPIGRYGYIVDLTYRCKDGGKFAVSQPMFFFDIVGDPDAIDPSAGPAHDDALTVERDAP